MARIEIDLYFQSQPTKEIILHNTGNFIADKAKFIEISRDLGANYAEFYITRYKLPSLFVGSVSKVNKYQFIKGRGYSDFLKL